MLIHLVYVCYVLDCIGLATNVSGSLLEATLARVGMAMLFNARQYLTETSSINLVLLC